LTLTYVTGMGRILAIFTASMVLGAAVLIGLRETYFFMMAIPWEELYPEPALQGAVEPMVLPNRPEHPKMASFTDPPRRRGLKVSELRRLKAAAQAKRRTPPARKSSKKRKKKKKKRRAFRKPRLQLMQQALSGGVPAGTSPGGSGFDSGPAPAPARQAPGRQTEQGPGYVEQAPARAAPSRRRRMRSYGAAGSVVLPEEGGEETEYEEYEAYDDEE